MFPKIGGFPPKWMVYFMENPIKMDDLGVPLFLETPKLKIRRTYIHGPRNRTHGRTHVSRTPKKPEYLIARSQLRGRLVRSH